MNKYARTDDIQTTINKINAIIKYGRSIEYDDFMDVISKSKYSVYLDMCEGAGYFDG